MFLFEPMKYLAELELFENYKIVSFNRKIDLSSLKDESTLHLKIHQQKMKVTNFLDILGKDLFYNIVEKKFKNRPDIPFKYTNFNETQLKYLSNQDTIKNIYARQYIFS